MTTRGREDKAATDSQTKQARFFDPTTQARTEMVGHLVRVDRAAPVVLENVPMGRLGPWLDPATQLTLCVSVLVLAAAIGLSAAARRKLSADNTNKTGT